MVALLPACQTDSISYGPNLTTFHPQRPIVILEYSEASSRIYTDTDFVLRLADAGIHALKTPGYTDTWLSVIHTQVLQKTGAMTKDLFDQIIAKLGPTTAKSYLDYDYFTQFLPDDPSGKSLAKLKNNEPLTLDELIAVYPILQASLFDAYYTQLIRLLVSADDPKAMFSQIFSNPAIYAYSSKWTLDSAINTFSASQVLLDQSPYAEILEEMSLGDLLPLLKSSKRLEKFKDHTKKIRARAKLINFAEIEEASDYTSKIEQIYGTTLKIKPSLAPPVDKQSLSYLSQFEPLMQKGTRDEYLAMTDVNSSPSTEELQSLYGKIYEEVAFKYFSDPAEPMVYEFNGNQIQIDTRQRIYFISSLKYFGPAQLVYNKELIKILAAKRNVKYDVPIIFNSLNNSIFYSLIQVRLLRDFLLSAKDDADFIERLKYSIELAKKYLSGLVALDPRLNKP